MTTTLVRHCGLAAAAAILFGCMGPRLGGERSSIIEDGPECVGARSPGFWCENQDGKNPNLTAEEFDMLAVQAAAFLTEVDELDTAEEVAAAVCDRSNQLARHLVAVVLDVEANLISLNSPLEDVEGFATVGEVVAEAIAILVAGEGDSDHAEDVKDILDEGIINGKNIILGDECVPEEEPFCGDGNVDEGEKCDDGNNEDGDGCSATCTIEEDEEPICGNGIVEGDEECDDGNLNDEDGCSRVCTEERN
jgi:cysteine-rich repeat protein